MSRSTSNLTVASVAAGGLALVLGACATANTPQQNLAYDRWAQCQVPYTQLERVDVNGRITFLASSSSAMQGVLQCLADAGRDGQRLPGAVAIRPTGGP